MKTPPPSPYARMFAALRKVIMEARTAEIYEQREQVTDEALRRVNAIEKILTREGQARGRTGGARTAQRGGLEVQRRPGQPEVRAKKVS